MEWGSVGTWIIVVLNLVTVIQAQIMLKKYKKSESGKDGN
jgi:hypothetical protein